MNPQHLVSVYVAGQIELSGQLVSTQVNLFQSRSVWSRYKTQITGHFFYQLMQKVS